MQLAMEDYDFSDTTHTVADTLKARMNVVKEDGNKLYFNDGISIDFTGGITAAKGCTDPAVSTPTTAPVAACKAKLDVNGDKGSCTNGKDCYNVFFGAQGLHCNDDKCQTAMMSDTKS